MTSPEIILTTRQEGSTCIITLQREKFYNALDGPLALELLAALRTAAADDSVRVIVITGAGAAFSAGQDVFELEREESLHGPASVGKQLRERLNPLIVQIRAIEKPVIAQVNGVATGAGLATALACDFRIMSENASFVMSPIGVGLIPGVGLSMLVPRMTGIGVATELFMLGERVPADRALELGLVNRVVAPEMLETATRELAEKLAGQPREVLGLTKRILNRSVFAGLEDHMNYESAVQEIAAGAEEHHRRLAKLTTRKDRS